jgi:hypothetical protein
MKLDPILEYERLQRAEAAVADQRVRLVLKSGGDREHGRRYLATLEAAERLQRSRWLRSLGIETGGGAEKPAVGPDF